MKAIIPAPGALRRALAVALALGLAVAAFGQDDSALFNDVSAGDSGPAAGQSPAAATDKAAPQSDFSLQLSDALTGSFHFSANPDAPGMSGPIKSPLLENQLGFQVKTGDLKVVGNWRLRVEPQNNADTLVSAVAQENAIYWSPSSLKFGLGWQNYAWGVADKQNPTDRLNPRDYTVGINADKLSVFSLSAQWYPIPQLSLTGVYVPFKQKDIFPTDFAASVRSGLAALNPGLSVSVRDPAMEVASFIAGGKIDLNLSAVDLSLSYIYDWDQYYSPVVSLAATGIHAPVSVLLEKQRIHRVGANIKTIIDAVGLWLEAGLNLPNQSAADSNDAIRNPDIAWTLGLDGSFGPGGNCYVNLQYIGDYVFNYDASYGSDYATPGTKFNPASAMASAGYMQTFLNRSLTQSLGAQFAGLDQGLVLDLKIPLADSLLTLKLDAAYVLPLLYDASAYTRLGSAVINPELDISPVDSMHIRLGVALCYAWVQYPDGSIRQNASADKIGVYGTDNNYYLKVEYSFNYLLKK